MDGARRARFSLWVACFTMWAASALAQPRPATLRVAVADSTGAVIVGASVEATNACGDRLVQATDQRGTALLSPLAPGR